MTTLKSVEEVVDAIMHTPIKDNFVYDTLNAEQKTFFVEEIRSALTDIITQDRTSLHTSLVAAVEGLKKKESPLHDAHQFYQVKDYNQAIYDTLTIINSIFKE